MHFLDVMNKNMTKSNIMKAKTFAGLAHRGVKWLKKPAKGVKRLGEKMQSHGFKTFARTKGVAGGVYGKGVEATGRKLARAKVKRYHVAAGAAAGAAMLSRRGRRRR